MLSVIICTFNRSYVLEDCLDSLLKVQSQHFIKEILVVDNNSTDNTKELVARFQQQSNLISYVFEPKQGLSNARNTGVDRSSSEWLLFLDDDAKISDASILEIEKTIQNYDFVMFSGIFKAWYKSPPPKWLPFDTGNYLVKGELGIRPIEDDYVSGGIMTINKDIFLKEVKRFPTQLGMSGGSIGFGEESFVEHTLKEKGYKIGINTNIVIDHLVNNSKYEVKWHLDAAFQKGFANAHISGGKSRINYTISLIRFFLFGWIKPLWKLLFRRKYFVQNFTIDYIGGMKYLQGGLAQTKN